MASVSAMLPARRVLQRRCLTPPCTRPLPVPLSRNKRERRMMGKLKAQSTAHAQPAHHGWSTLTDVLCLHVVLVTGERNRYVPRMIASTAGATATLPHST